MDTLTMNPQLLTLMHAEFINLSRPVNPTIHPLAQDDIFKLIDVRLPYYALYDVYYLSEGKVGATIVTESPIGFQRSPITMAEACRHLAILGSVACATRNPKKTKHHYLARRGSFSQISHKDYVPDKKFTLFAECISFEKRAAVAKACLIDEDHEIVCGISVTFDVVSEDIFQRLFTKTPGYVYTANTPNPYIRKTRLLAIQFFKGKATASLEKIGVQDCYGHFPHYPALPVAMLVAAIHELCIQFIQHIHQNNHLQVTNIAAKLLADNLALAGESILLEVELGNRTTNEYEFHGIARTDTGKIVGDLTVFMGS